MEWAIGKQLDVYPTDTGKLLLPGARIRWDVHYHSVGEATRDNVMIGIYLYPKGEVPKYRARRIAVSTVIARFPLTIALTRFIGTRRARANSFRLTSISWSSSLSNSPG